MPQYNKMCRYIEDSFKKLKDNNSTPSTINSLILRNRIPFWADTSLVLDISSIPLKLREQQHKKDVKQTNLNTVATFPHPSDANLTELNACRHQDCVTEVLTLVRRT
jgi:hypothetical protein